MEFKNENVNPEQSTAYVQLQELSNSDYEIKKGEPDIIGWDIKNDQGSKIGEVDELIFDPQARKVRYIVLNMEGNEMDLEDERRVLIPIGLAQLHTENDDVVIPQISEHQLSTLPPYEGCPELTPELEMRTRSVFDTSLHSAAPYQHPEFYGHEHFNEDRFYSRSPLPDNSTIIPADDMDQAGEATRAERVSHIVDRINHQGEFAVAAPAEELKDTDFAAGEPVNTAGVEPVITNDFEHSGYEAATGTPETIGFENEERVDDYAGEEFATEPEAFEESEQEETSVSTADSKLMEFFVNELKDLLWAEQELLGTLPDMAEAATSAELKTAFQNHFNETEVHVKRLNQAFALLGLEPDTTKCDAMAGIVEEGDGIISDTDEGSAQRDVGLIFAAQKAEHYEIASYGGMISLAKTLGYYDIAELFVLTIDEEKSADAVLTEIAENHVNYDAGRESAN